MAYCTADDVLVVLQARGVDDPGETQRTYVAEIASYLVDAYTHRHFRDEAVVEGHQPPLVSLHHWPLVEIISVKTDDDDEEDVSYKIISKIAAIIEVYTDRPVRIEYKYNNTTTPCPTVIKEVTAEIAANILQAPPDNIERLTDAGLTLEGLPLNRYITPNIARILNGYKHIGIR